MGSSLFRLACVGLLLVTACKRAPADKQRGEQNEASIIAPGTAEVNPFLRSYESAVIVYETADHTRRSTWSVKGFKTRQVDEGSAFDAPGDYSLRGPDYDYNIVASRSQVVEITSAENILFGLYRKLDPRAKAAVMKSLAVIGADLPFYSEHEATFLRRENIAGLDAACYRFYQSMLDDTSERCYWRGFEVSLTGKNPISGEHMSGRVTHVDRKAAIDDSAFTWPEEFQVQHHDPGMDEIMTDIYAQLIERMQRPDFTLAQLSRYAR